MSSPFLQVQKTFHIYELRPVLFFENVHNQLSKCPCVILFYLFRKVSIWQDISLFGSEEKRTKPQGAHSAFDRWFSFLEYWDFIPHAHIYAGSFSFPFFIPSQNQLEIFSHPRHSLNLTYVICKGLTLGDTNHYVFRFSILYLLKIIFLIDSVQEGNIYNILSNFPRIVVIGKDLHFLL